MPSSLGFVAIDRGIQDWQFFGNMAIRGFWLYLIVKASWKDRWFGKGVKVKRGSFVTTFQRMAEENEASEKTIRKYLKLFEDAGQITVETTNKYTTISIINYDEFQLGSELCEGNKTYQNTDQRTGQSTDQGTDQRSVHKNKEKKETKKQRKINARETSSLGASSSSSESLEDSERRAALLKSLKGEI